jgi:hypothetical protein
MLRGRTTDSESVGESPLVVAENPERHCLRTTGNNGSALFHAPGNGFAKGDNIQAAPKSKPRHQAQRLNWKMRGDRTKRGGECFSQGTPGFGPERGARFAV